MRWRSLRSNAILCILWVLFGALAVPLAAQTLIVANKSDHTADLIDIATGESLATLPTGHAPHEVAVSPDGRTAVVSNYGDREEPGSSLTVIDVAGREVRATIELGRHSRPHGVAFLGGERLALTTEGSAHLLVVDLASGRVVSEIETAQEVSHMVAVTPDGRRAFVANIGSGTVTAVDLDTATKLGDVATGDGAEGIAVTPDGAEVWVANRAADTISLLDAESLEIRGTLPCPGFPIRVEITPDGRRALVSAARSGEVVLFDVGERRELLRKQLDLSTAADAASRLFGDRFGDSPVPVGIQLSADGERAWVAATQADAVVEIRTADLQVLRVLEAGHEPDGMALAPAASD